MFWPSSDGPAETVSVRTYRSGAAGDNRGQSPLKPIISTEAKRSGEISAWISNAWAVFQTFVFITFTRLFFRSGSNLDPELANEQAWFAAKSMVERIGGDWDLSLIPTMAWQHRGVLLVFLFGMLVHWLPERWKRRYRMGFATLPLPVMAVAVVAIVFGVYQFITAGLQTFIYFQF